MQPKISTATFMIPNNEMIQTEKGSQEHKYDDKQNLNEKGRHTDR